MKELYKTNDRSSISFVVRKTVDFAINSNLQKKRLGSCAAKLLKQKGKTFEKQSIRS